MAHATAAQPVHRIDFIVADQPQRPSNVAVLNQTVWRTNLEQLFATVPSLLLIGNIIGVHEQSLHGILRKKRPFPRAHARIIERLFGLTNGAFDQLVPPAPVDSALVLAARRTWIADVIDQFPTIYAASAQTGIGFKTLHGLSNGRIAASGAIVGWISSRSGVAAPPEIAQNRSAFRIPNIS